MEKVRAGWYTTDVVTQESQAENDNQPLIKVDVSLHPKRRVWTVSTRNSMDLNTRDGFVAEFKKARATKKYAHSYAEYLQGGRHRKPRPSIYAE